MASRDQVGGRSLMSSRFIGLAVACCGPVGAVPAVFFFSPMIDLFLLLLHRRSECEEEEQAEMKRTNRERQRDPIVLAFSGTCRYRVIPPPMAPSMQMGPRGHLAFWRCLGPRDDRGAEKWPRRGGTRSTSMPAGQVASGEQLMAIRPRSAFTPRKTMKNTSHG
jgi:hypothetical protein